MPAGLHYGQAQNHPQIRASIIQHLSATAGSHKELLGGNYKLVRAKELIVPSLILSQLQ